MRPISFPRGIPSAASTLNAGEIMVRSARGAGPQIAHIRRYRPGTLNRTILLVFGKSRKSPLPLV